MRTLIIMNNGGIVSHTVVDGDHSRFHDVEINFTNTGLEEELYDFLYDSEGMTNFIFTKDVSVIEDKHWDRVAIVGYY